MRLPEATKVLIVASVVTVSLFAGCVQTSEDQGEDGADIPEIPIDRAARALP